MYTWTPTTHAARAIEAWPLCRQCRRWIRRPADAKREIRKEDKSSTILPPRRTDTRCQSRIPGRTIATYQPSKKFKDDREKNSKYTANTRRRRFDSKELPLPPFLRDNASLKAKERRYREEADQIREAGEKQLDDHPEDQPDLQSNNPRRAARREEDKLYHYSGTFRGYGAAKKSLQGSAEKFPFSTAFAQNPYAHALATPVRFDNFANVRQPLSCLADFHLRNLGDAEKPQLSLEHLSSVAAQRSKRKPAMKLTDEEVYVEETWNSEKESFRPNQLCSHTANSKDVLEYVTENPKQRVTRFVLSQRTMKILEEEHKRGLPIQWRSDMPDYVLHSLRRVICKKMRYFLQTKTRADSEGMVQAPPGDAGLERLDHVNHVMCVLALQAPSFDETGPEEDELPSVFQESTAPISADSSAEIDSTSSADSEETNEPYPSIFENLDESREPSPDRIETLENDQGENDPAPANNEQPGPSPPRTRTTSSTYKVHEGGWTFRGLAEHAFFLRNTRQLPPPAQPSLTYFATARYRNLRVPFYNLPHLLGEENVVALVKDTVFENSKIITLNRSFSHVDLQTWLLKLSGYIATSKANTPKTTQ